MTNRGFYNTFLYHLQSELFLEVSDIKKIKSVWTRICGFVSRWTDFMSKVMENAEVSDAEKAPGTGSKHTRDSQTE